MKNIIIAVVALVLLGAGVWYVTRNAEAPAPVIEEETIDPLTAESQQLVGIWQSDQDVNAQIIFAEDGTTTDLYDGEQLSSGVWGLYTDEDAEYNPSGLFLRSVLNGETYEYAVVELTQETLVLSYLERGNILEYSRVVE